MPEEEKEKERVLVPVRPIRREKEREREEPLRPPEQLPDRWWEKPVVPRRWLPNPIYRYKSPYRPLPMNYLPKDVKWLYEYSTIGAWTPDTIYAFNKPIPKRMVEQWDLEIVGGKRNPGVGKGRIPEIYKLGFGEAQKPDIAFVATMGARNDRGEYVACIAERNKRGYAVTDKSFGTKDYNKAQEIADAWNGSILGLTPDEAWKIVASSMRRNPMKYEDKYAEHWTGSVEDLVRKVARSDARYAVYDKSGAYVRLNISGGGLMYITSPDGDNMYDAYTQREAVKILTNIRKGKKFPDMNPMKRVKLMVHPDVKQYLEMAKGDAKAGHTTAEEFWKGAASGALIAGNTNPRKEGAMPTKKHYMTGDGHWKSETEIRRAVEEKRAIIVFSHNNWHTGGLLYIYDTADEAKKANMKMTTRGKNYSVWDDTWTVYPTIAQALKTASLRVNYANPKRKTAWCSKCRRTRRIESTEDWGHGKYIQLSCGHHIGVQGNPARSWKGAVMAVGESTWSYSGLRFPTKKECDDYGVDLLGRWMGAKEYRSEPSNDPPNYTFKNWQLKALNPLINIRRNAMAKRRSSKKGGMNMTNILLLAGLGAGAYYLWKKSQTPTP